MNNYIASDGNGETRHEASSLEEAAKTVRKEYASAYDSEDSTLWVSLMVRNEEDPDERTSFKLTVEPTEPACSKEEHEYQSPHELLGGCKENPGVWGSGGGVLIKEVCMHCGTVRKTDTWAQDPADGEQGLESVSYLDRELAEEVEELRNEEEVS